MSAFVKSVARWLRRMSHARPASAASAPSYAVPDTYTMLAVRAHRIHNRNAEAARVYLRKHAILFRGQNLDA